MCWGLWLVKRWSCTSCTFIPISMRRFPPLAKGGLGGWSRHDQSQGLAMLSPSQSFRIPLAGREESFSISKAPTSPPLTPPSQGGERDRSLATSFHRAQQKHASRNRPFSSVNTNFSPASTLPDRSPASQARPFVPEACLAGARIRGSRGLRRLL